MKTGEVLNGKYRIEKLLGKGGSGQVYLCTHLLLGNKWAVKHIPEAGINSSTLSEIEILKKLYHISLPRIIDVFRDERGIFIVESNIEGTALDKLVQRHGRHSTEKVVDWALELCDILKYLHNAKPKPIIYRDMKPANIIITQDSRLALVDFGISQEYSRLQNGDTCIAGTVGYAAPEQLIRGGRTDQRTDIYNLGATLYQLLHGRLKQEGKEPVQYKDKARMRLNRLVLKCMEGKPEDRYQRVEDIIEELMAIKSMLIVKKARGQLILKLEIVLAVILSLTSCLVSAYGYIKMLSQ